MRRLRLFRVEILGSQLISIPRCSRAVTKLCTAQQNRAEYGVEQNVVNPERRARAEVSILLGWQYWPRTTNQGRSHVFMIHQQRLQFPETLINYPQYLIRSKTLYRSPVISLNSPY
jgi:hypothetical protein